MSDPNPNRFARLLENVSTRIMGTRQPYPGVDAKIQEALIGLDASAGAGLFTRGKSVTTPKSISGYYNWYENDGVVFSSVNGLSEAATGLGYFNKMPKDFEQEDEEEVPEAIELVNDLGKELQLDSLTPNICKNMLIAGFCPVEFEVDKFPSKCAVKVLHPMTIKEIVLGGDEYHGIKSILQKVKGVRKPVEIQGENLAWFVNNQIGNDKRGKSIIKPVSNLLSIKSAAVTNMGKIIDRYLAPLIIWKSTGPIAGIKAAVEEREADEDIYFGGLQPDDMKDIAQPIEITGRARFTEFIAYIDQLIYIGLYAPNLYYWRNATEASARVLSEMVDRNVRAIQRSMKRGMEAGFYDRLMAANDIDITPRLSWGVEKTGIEDIQLEAIISTALQVGLFNENNLQALLTLGGIDVGKLGYGGIPPEREPVPEIEPEVEPEEEPEEEEALFARALESLTPEVKKKIKRLRISISPERTAEELREDLDQFRGHLLTNEEKEYRLQGLANEIESGEVDEEMIPYLEKINSYPFIVTTQSCTGHGEDRGTGRQAHVDFRCALPIHMVMDDLLMPMDEQFSPQIFFTLMGLWSDRLRYVMDFDNDTWEEQLSYFIDLLEEVSEYWNDVDKIERLME